MMTHRQDYYIFWSTWKPRMYGNSTIERSTREGVLLPLRCFIADEQFTGSIRRNATDPRLRLKVFVVGALFMGSVGLKYTAKKLYFLRPRCPRNQEPTSIFGSIGSCAFWCTFFFKKLAVSDAPGRQHPKTKNQESRASLFLASGAWGFIG